MLYYPQTGSSKWFFQLGHELLSLKLCGLQMLWVIRLDKVRWSFHLLQEKLPPTDSRLRPDQRCLENGEYEMANAEKIRLEQRQRQVTIWSLFQLYMITCQLKIHAQAMSHVTVSALLICGNWQYFLPCP